MKDTLILRFLYRTVPGRLLLRLLTHPLVSQMVGRLLSSRASARLATYYIRRYGIDLSGIEVPEGGFPSFNAFFTRKRKEDGSDVGRADVGRGIADVGNAAAGVEPGRSAYLLSPCEGFLSVLDIREHTVLDVKHTEFSVKDLLRDGKLAARFTDGLALVFRLTPANYHRYCYAADGRVVRWRRISGRLHCVRPVALRTYPVFVQNSREYQVLRTESFGVMVQMEVGALLVGKITNYPRTKFSPATRAGEEKGYFEFGGSTIILLLEKGRARVPDELIARKNENGEIPVRMGEHVAERT